MSRRKKGGESIEIPITPMLDMAFQLLTFFILTYHPMPSEVQFVMNLMPASPEISRDAAPPADAAPNPNLPASLKTLPTLLRSGEGGTLGRITLSETDVPVDQNFNSLRRELLAAMSDKDLPFEQTLIKVDPNLKYSELVRVIDVFSEVFSKVKKPAKISFAELGSADAG
ncbi:MAG: biopolymer transporter ExbD [Isosphaeraceae bacterium]|nr:biopolymer transporter ExbD [Isosphaeraceae bacterium]